ncbi:PREDICTED: proline-rich protein HaeIII subfamily 1-like [Nanorana parkeri]|uniref:proline-rich protein HaeIII subfamily 1-like n=1 Tax=Nanorana parkeri TaxID=125878 RepID=UPI000854EB90|nr:PREDICTED: proline-rich protein HaeIII subfamily 1-like [Nanorana parkeri]
MVEEKASKDSIAPADPPKDPADTKGDWERGAEVQAAQRGDVGEVPEERPQPSQGTAVSLSPQSMSPANIYAKPEPQHRKETPAGTAPVPRPVVAVAPSNRPAGRRPSYSTRTPGVPVRPHPTASRRERPIRPGDAQVKGPGSGAPEVTSGRGRTRPYQRWRPRPPRRPQTKPGARLAAPANGTERPAAPEAPSLRQHQDRSPTPKHPRNTRRPPPDAEDPGKDPQGHTPRQTGDGGWGRRGGACGAKASRPISYIPRRMRTRHPPPDRQQRRGHQEKTPQVLCGELAPPTAVAAPAA